MNPRLKAIAKSTGVWVLGLLVLGALLFLTVVAVDYIVRFCFWIDPWMQLCWNVTLTVCLALLLVALIPPARIVCVWGFFFASFIFGAAAWVVSVETAALIWGDSAVWWGLVLGGIGVAPVALLAAVIRGTWSEFADVAFVIALPIGARFFADGWRKRWMTEAHDWPSNDRPSPIPRLPAASPVARQPAAT